MNPVIGQAELTVKDLTPVVEFYENILGLQALEKTNGKVTLSADGYQPLIHLHKKENIELNDSQAPGLYHIAFLLPQRSDLADFLYHMMQKQYRIIGASDHIVSEAIYLSDPEGNGIEVYADRPKELWTWEDDRVLMTTDRLDIDDLLRNQTKAGWSRMPTGAMIGHIHLQVNDLHLSKRFYCKGLGFDLVAHYGSQALFISKRKYHHHIGLNTWHTKGTAIKPQNRTGLQWYSIHLPNHVEMERISRQLDILRVPYILQNNELVTTDPSGITVKLQL